MMRCDHCEEPAEFVEPGTAEEAWDLFVLRRPVPMRCWCLGHFVTEFGGKRLDGVEGLH